MKKYVALIFVIIGFEVNATQSILKIEIDNFQWSLVIGQSYATNLNDLPMAERDLLREIRPLIEAKQYAEAEGLLTANSEKKSATLLRLQGQVYLAQEKYEQAEELLLAAYNLAPNDVVTIQNLATIFVIMQEYKTAQKYLSKAIENGVSSAQVYGQLGFVNIKTAIPVSSVAAYQKALMFEPYNEQWYRGLLFALIRSKANEQASELVNQLLVKLPTDSQLWLQRAQLALNMGLNTEALSSLESAYVLGQKNSDVILQLAMLHIESGSVQRAFKLIQGNEDTLFVSDNVNKYFHAVYSIATWLADQNENELLASLTELLTKQKLSDANSSLIQYLSAQVALQKNKRSQAIAYLEKSLRLDPSNGDALLLLANLFYSDSNLFKAKMLYARAESMVQYKLSAKLGLAQLAIDIKDYQAALTLLREVYNENPTQTALIGNINKLEDLINNAP